MKKALLIIFVLLTVLMSGCAPTDTSGIRSDPNQLSVANTQTVEFIGKTFEFNWKVTDQPVQIYVYYPPGEIPSDWVELVEFQIYPVNPNGNNPLDFANGTATAFIQQYPDMQYEILSDNDSDTAILDFLYPTSTRTEEGKEFLEFAAFKYYRDPNSSQIMAFHYAKNIEFINPSSSRTFDDVLSDITTTREEVESALAEFPLFSQ